MEDEADTAAIDDPFDPTTIRISTKQPTVDLVVDRMRHEEIILQPDFQRGDNVWPIRTRSRLIESLLLRIPLPVFYMAADRNDNWKVVDGLQRLSTLRDFVLNKKLRLRGLEYLIQFDGNSFDDLPRPMQRRITETQLSCHVIEPGTPPEVMYNVFKRINTEGRPLVAQEIRHALNPGPARELLRELAHSDEFLRATARSVSSRRMADQECVLRFLAFRTLGEAQYRGKLDDFLTSAMRILNGTPGKARVIERRLHPCHVTGIRHLWTRGVSKTKATRIHPLEKSGEQALVESLSVALAEVPSEHSGLLRKRKEKLSKP